MFGSTAPAMASRFLAEVPDELVRDSGQSYLKRPARRGFRWQHAAAPGGDYRPSSLDDDTGRRPGMTSATGWQAADASRRVTEDPSAPARGALSKIAEAL